MSNPVAIITGASSGIGLALAHHLLAKSWDVVFVDLKPPPASAALPPNRTLHLLADISSWRDQSTAFARAHAWHRRLDLAILNAGIDDRDSIFPALTQPPTLPPTEPNFSTFRVNLLAVYAGIKLFAHYASLSPRTTSPKHIIVTASAASLYPLPAVPEYTATKHALVGLVRALAPGAAEKGFAINAVCPDMVPTGLAPPGLMERYPAAAKTPMATMMRAYDELLGGAERRNGAVLEVVVDALLWAEAPAPRARQAAVGPEVAALWDEVYRERNVGFARRAEEEARRREREGGGTGGKGSKL